MRFTRLLPLALSLAVLAGCGGDEDDTAAVPRATPAAAEAFPVTIDHAYGSTTIPERPTRVLTLGLSDQDAVLALGVTPIAVSEWYGDYPHAAWPWAQDELADGAPTVLNNGERNETEPGFEEIASLRPDLILSLYNATTSEQYEKLSQIAPTVVPPKGSGNFTITWPQTTRLTGRALGREAEAERLIDDLEAKFAAAAKEHPEFAGQEALVAERFEPGTSVVRTGNDIRAKFFADLGFRTPTEVAGAKPDQYGEIEVSDERLPSLSRDLLVWNVGSNPEVRKQIEAMRLYRSLPVVKRDRVLWLEDPVISGAFSWGTVLSLDFALEQLVPDVADTVAGRTG